MPPLRHILIRIVLLILGASLAMAVSCIAAYPFMTFPAPQLASSSSAGDIVSALILFPVTIILVALQPFVTVAMIWQIALIGALASEVFGLRSWVFHVANGAFAAALSAGSLSLFAAPGDSQMPLGFVAAGGVSGLVYWLIAGRSAGFRLPKPAPAEAPRDPPST